MLGGIWLPHPMRRGMLELPPLKVIRTKGPCNFWTPMWVSSTLVTTLFYNSTFQLVHPDKIILYHQWGGRASKLIQSYKPSGPHISHLRNIDLRMSAWDTIIFDFSSVSDATIHAEFYLLRGASVCTCLSIFVAPSWPKLQTAWKDFKPILRRSFAEGLDGYDVSRHFETVTVFRPSLVEIEVGWKPKNAAHEDDDDENDELSQLYLIGRRVLIRDVWYVRSFVSIEKYLC